MEFIKDKMVINIKVNGKKIKSVEKGFLFGKMAIPMMDNGKMGNNMEEIGIKVWMESYVKVYG